MSDDGRMNQTLTLLARPGAYEVLHAMHRRDGTATFAQIATEARRPLSLLRALSAEGFVTSYHCGTLDMEPDAATSFCLTARGEAVAGHLTRLQEWITNRAASRGKHPAN